MNQDFLLAKERGIGADQAIGFFPYDVVDGKIVLRELSNRQMAQDAAMVTIPSVGAPAALYTYLDPRIIDVLFAATNATKFFEKSKVGDWVDDFAQFPVEEITGQAGPYADFGDGVQTDVNYEYPVRQSFRYQTMIKYGDLEAEKTARAKINLAARKQNAAAQILARAENRFQLYGVSGIECYGMLNDPNLPATIAPISVNSKSTWAEKTAADPSNTATIVYNDVNKLWMELAKNNGGNIDVNTPVTLGISNTMIGYLTQPNQFGKTAKQLLQENYPNITIVQLPELSTSAGEMLYMSIPDLGNDDPTGLCAFSRAFQLHRLIPKSSSFEQKASAATWGCVIRRPNFVATMTGI
nr:MAG TPA: major capsid protein [Caudoviricetes sp.]